MAQGNTTMVTEAGRKLRAWRKRQIPPMSAHDAGRWLGLSFMSIYRLETGVRGAGGKVMRALIAQRICRAEDFDMPAQDESSPSQRCA